MKNMKTFTKLQKAKWLKIAKRHQEADRFIQGNWIKEKKEGEYRGCFFGCMMQTNDNVLQTASAKMRIPFLLVRISERIFERLSLEESVLFPVELLESIPTNKNIKPLFHKFLYNILVDKKIGVIQFTKKGSDQYKAIKRVSKLFKEGGSKKDFSAAYAAAYAANNDANNANNAVDAAVDAVDAAAYAAAYAANNDANNANNAVDAVDAAVAAAAYDAAYAARKDHFSKIKDMLIKELKNFK